MLPAHGLEENGVIEMPFSENKPSIDGKWTTPDEWSDASQTTIGSGNNVMILLVKHDRDYLYIMGDMIRDFSENRSVFSMVLDTNNNGGSTPDSEDVFLGTYYIDAAMIRAEWAGPEKKYTTANEKGEKIPFVGWLFLSGPAPGSARATSLSSTNDPFESTLPHKIFEFKIPFSLLYKNDKYGFAMIYSGPMQNLNQISDDDIVWPETVRRSDSYFAVPDDYGVLMDSKNQVTIPPIPVISVSVTSFSFGNEEISEKSSPKTVTIANQGTSVLKINSVRTSGEFSIPDLKTPIEIQPSQSVSLGVVFAPITIGEKSGTITISSNDLSKPTMTVSLSGKGIEKGESPLGGGCLIATAAFGSELAPQVQLLRELRDNVVLGTHSGASFMATFNQFYYSFSPTISDWERQNPTFKEAVRITITPMLSTLSILNYVEIDSEQEMLGYGIGIILLNLGLYFVAPAIVILKIRSVRS